MKYINVVRGGYVKISPRKRKPAKKDHRAIGGKVVREKVQKTRKWRGGVRESQYERAGVQRSQNEREGIQEKEQDRVDYRDKK